MDTHLIRVSAEAGHYETKPATTKGQQEKNNSLNPTRMFHIDTEAAIVQKHPRFHLIRGEFQ